MGLKTNELQKQKDNDMFIYFVKPEDFRDIRLCIYRHFLLPVGFRMVRSLELRDSEPESFFFSSAYFILFISG